MPMKMGWRWYGEGNDPVTLSDIKQIPGVTSIVWALHNKMPGEIWEIDEIQKVADQIHAYGFDMDVVESVNVHDDIKIGLPTRDKYIENYKQCIRNLSKFGVKVICYNFMPIFDWTRTDLFHPVGDGSTALFYEKDKIKGDYKSMAEYIMSFTEKYNMTFPGWEPERMAKLDHFFEKYGGLTIVITRFMPFFRTFAPFIAGTGHMNFAKFTFFNCLGGISWVSLFVLVGYFFGGVPFVQEHFEVIVLGIVAVSVAPAVIGAVKAALSARKSGTRDFQVETAAEAERLARAKHAKSEEEN